MWRSFLTFALCIVALAAIVAIYDALFMTAIYHDLLPVRIGKPWVDLLPLVFVPFVILMIFSEWAYRMEYAPRRVSLLPAIVIFSALNWFVIGCFPVFTAPGACT